MTVGGGRMNYTSSSTLNTTGGAAIPRIAADLAGAATLPTTQDWSLQIDAHLNATSLTTQSQFSDVFLGFGKTGDWVNTHVTFEFDRGWWSTPGWDIGEDVRINGVNAPDLFTVNNLTSPDVALRLAYNATNHTITYYFDSNGAAGGYNWVAQGTANLASGTYNLGLTGTDTFTIILVGSSGYQNVANTEANLSNLVITISQTPVVTTGAATAITNTSATLNGTVNPNGLATTAKFEYGLTTAYGSSTNVTLSPSNGVAAQAVSATINGLQAGATYHFRLTATNSDGAVLGSDTNFTTIASPLPTITSHR